MSTGTNWFTNCKKNAGKRHQYL